ncbi:arabinose-5-phosphate isomerase [Hydrogenivirga caldilitoris]|uniref:Arabinose-5-phosphate isomerase n=1 Tax=Hydrogenivirga caldilitoris TaxID=246264 RepID=A0A497XPJ1_9AQUI|nr:KpsF/GutQ family sugar-phosphate isomerase [Hydrogenivirga caldilitoris]RLJ70060.1 arabinose-5-phosphate isomerase [Hydrogenivirga caldilitoris]
MNPEDVLSRAKRVIKEEIEGLERLKTGLDENFVRAVELILNCKGKVIVTGIGKSGHVARKIASTLASTGTPAHFLHPSEALHGDLGVIDKGDVVIAISNSGESAEVVQLLPYIKMLGNPLIAITNRRDSTLAKYSDVHLYLNVDKEACPLQLAPTTSSTATLVLGDALAMTLLELKGFTERDFALRHPGGTLGRKLRLVRDLYHTGEELPVVREDTPMKEVVLEITSKGFGATAVVDSSGRLTGIITDGDLRRFVKRGGDLNSSLARDVMTPNPKTTRAEEMALEALRRMEEHKITVLIVVNGEGKPEGIIHLHDILRAEINL